MCFFKRKSCSSADDPASDGLCCDRDENPTSGKREKTRKKKALKTLEGPSEAFEAGEEVFYNEVGKFLFAAQVMLAQTCLRLIV